MRRSGLLAWLLHLRSPQPSWRSVHAQSLLLRGDELRALGDEVDRLRAAEQRSASAAVQAQRRAEQLERELAAVRAETSALRADLSALREELLWAFAEGTSARRAPRVVDLTRPVADTA